MPYIGISPNFGNLSTQAGTGDGSDVTPIATLDYTVASSASIGVYLDGVRQVAGTDYVANGTTLTFTTAPPEFVKIEVVFFGLSVDIGTPGDNTVTNAKMADNAIDSDELAAGAVDLAHMSADSVDSSQLIAGSVDLTHLSATGTASSSTILKGNNTWATESTGGPSLGTDHIIRTNALTIAETITFAGTENGMTAGPITISSGVITVTSPSVWTII